MKAHIITFGCTANQLHSEVIAGLLKKSGCKITDQAKNADLVIINTCIVKEPTEKRVLHKIKEVQSKFPKKKLIIAGCMPSGEREKLDQFKNLTLVGTHNITDIVKAVKGLDNQVENRPEPKLCKPKIRKNSIVNITEISQGCNSACSFCVTRIAKGKLYSYPPELIIKDIKSALKDGCKEIWITSQDNSTYVAFSRLPPSSKGRVSQRRERSQHHLLRRDADYSTQNRVPSMHTRCGTSLAAKPQDLMQKTEKINLPKLLEEICKIKGDFFVRVGMMNPAGVKPILKELVEVYKNPKILKFLHIPVQSGSDQVLRKMNRKYSVKDFEKIVSTFRKVIPKITISTDVIVGFPGETEQDFQKTLDLIKKIKPNKVNLSKFGKRPGTLAEKMKQVDNKIIKKRSIIVSKLIRSLDTKPTYLVGKPKQQAPSPSQLQ